MIFPGSKKYPRFIWLLLCLGSAQAHGARKPDLVLQGTLTRADHETYRRLPFRVPPRVHRITVEFSFTGKDQRTTVDLGLLGPSGFRGWSGGNKSSLTVSTSDATPSYLRGPEEPGIWKILIGIPNIRAGVRSAYRANIFFDFAGQPPQRTSEFGPAIRTGPDWYRGDLHMHTGHSDGNCNSQSGKSVPCPVFKTLEAASARKLDFIAVSDHNTVSHFNALRELAPYFDRLLLLHAREITTFQGHANVYGSDQFIDFRVSSRELPDMNALLRQTRELGGLVSINHPSAPGGEQCMGCRWSPHPEADMHLVDAVEAINGFRPSIAFWEAQLNRGFRLTGVGGSDNHDADDKPPQEGAIGTPATVVYADQLSESAILAGIRAGHVFIDLEGGRDRGMEFSGTAAGQTAGMGDGLQAAAGVDVDFSLAVVGVPEARVEVIEDGKPLTAAISGAGKFLVRSDGGRHWVRINVRSARGELVLLGNPIYLNWKP